MHETVKLSLPSLRQALSLLSFHIQLFALIADVFSVDALEIAKQFNLKSYVYFPMSVTSLCFCLKFPELDEDHEMVSTGFGDLSQPLKLPGCVPLNGKDLFDTVQERSSESYKTVLYICKRLHLADGMIVNSFLDLERGAITSLQESNHKHPPIYPVGPILKTESTTINESTSKCLKWLDNQQKNSVLYVSFGSGGTLTHDQLHELALGLEMSGHKFLWVVRAPSRSTSSAYLNSQNENPLDHMPKGFIERTKGQGFVVPSWAPQIEILRHCSTGGFLTHCGWNSTLESVLYGKPMIVWPLFAEQRMNAVLLTEKFKVAVWPKFDENKHGIIVKEEVARVVKLIMEDDQEGNETRRRVQVFQDAATKALGEDGSSARAISNLAHELKYMGDM
ncbi:hydroquinone glucosyltransferase-like [Neltuma alba]|uniref:hydroquinone glucosyltransferase-like n=1 Tax=Neltuma alba TaxID=207710 RepID=UPI0010A583C8|nr:hydroquinone glucosyltransferase-like [Prosopis alba]